MNPAQEEKKVENLPKEEQISESNMKSVSQTENNQLNQNKEDNKENTITELFRNDSQILKAYDLNEENLKSLRSICKYFYLI